MICDLGVALSKSTGTFGVGLAELSVSDWCSTHRILFQLPKKKKKNSAAIIFLSFVHCTLSRHLVLERKAHDIIGWTNNKGPWVGCTNNVYTQKTCRYRHYLEFIKEKYVPRMCIPHAYFRPGVHTFSRISSGYNDEVDMKIKWEMWTLE